MFQIIGPMLLFVVASLYLVAGISQASESDIDSNLRVPPGFQIEELASVPNARSMALGDGGTLFVSSLFVGKLHAVKGFLGADPDVQLLAEKLRIPNGVAFNDGDLFVAERNRLLRYEDIEGRLDAPGEPVVIADDLLGDKLHSWKYIAFGPDEKLYITVGSPCNICDEPDYGQIIRMDRDGGNREVYARGIRNSVGIAWQPGTEILWFTDNNRDMMGDDEPPGELNRAPEAGMHFGFPFCHGSDIVEPNEDLAALGSCADSVPPAQALPAHVAPLGLVFYTGVMFPESYQNQIFIAEHGSWNRSEKIGYRVSLVRLDKSGRHAVSYEPFVEGWLRGDDVGGRPVDLLVAPDGSLLISDDQAGKIYRVSYVGATKD